MWHGMKLRFKRALDALGGLATHRPRPQGISKPFYGNVEANPYTRVLSLLQGHLRAPQCQGTQLSPGFRQRFEGVCNGSTSLSSEIFVPVRHQRSRDCGPVAFCNCHAQF
jgi:hypothetical protein